MKKYHLFIGIRHSKRLGWDGYTDSWEDLDALIEWCKHFQIEKAEWAHILETKPDGSLDLVARLIENDFAFYGEYKENR